jgi:hypothetical protein
MGTSFVGISNRGFWMNDSLLEIWLRFLALHIKDPVSPGSLATIIRDKWLLASKGYFQGCIPEYLETAISTPEGEAIVREAIESLLESLAKSNAHLDMNTINLMGIVGSAFVDNIETWRLVETGEAYLALLDGKILTGASDTSFMPGSGFGPNPSFKRTR